MRPMARLDLCGGLQLLRVQSFAESYPEVVEKSKSGRRRRKRRLKTTGFSRPSLKMAAEM